MAGIAPGIAGVKDPTPVTAGLITPVVGNAPVVGKAPLVGKAPVVGIAPVVGKVPVVGSVPVPGTAGGGTTSLDPLGV